jgi:signal transduction histidine kinase
LALPLFRILQEALTNTAKHANAHSVDVYLQLQNVPMHIEIRDDGIGFDSIEMAGVPKSGGLGMMNMRETAEFVGASLTVHSRAGVGTTVRVDIAAPMEGCVA